MTRVTFEGQRYPLKEDESVLDALLRGGAAVEHSCRKGTCHVCLLKATSGDPGEAATHGLPDQARAKGYFLPCQCRPSADLLVTRPERSELFLGAIVHEVAEIAPGIARLLLEPESNVSARPGQWINLRGPGGDLRTYSLANVPEEDYFLEIHVKEVPSGKVSPWLARQVKAGDRLEITGPTGSCTFEPMPTRTPLVLIGTGTGIGPMLGIARDALAQGHEGSIAIYHGVRAPEHLYLASALQTLEAQHENVSVHLCVSDGSTGDYFRGRAVEAAFEKEGVPSDCILYLAGLPEAVEEARVRAIAAGIPRENIHADAFEGASRPPPKDREKLKNLGAESELWEALDQGRKLKDIFREFYGLVFEDARLAPYFHRITKERAIDKQYEFTVDLISGSRKYFGLGPFNAHHWMVISDELFDYRERLLEGVIRKHGIKEPLLHRWLALHERFRREIVKSSPRGLFVDGVERPLGGWEEETLMIGSICDGCESSMEIGETGRVNTRTGKMYCAGCSARRIGETLRPRVDPISAE